MPLVCLISRKEMLFFLPIFVISFFKVVSEWVSSADIIDACTIAGGLKAFYELNSIRKD